MGYGDPVFGGQVPLVWFGDVMLMMMLGDVSTAGLGR